VKNFPKKSEEFAVESVFPEAKAVTPYLTIYEENIPNINPIIMEEGIMHSFNLKISLKNRQFDTSGLTRKDIHLNAQITFGEFNQLWN
jgi:hypothetical protein